jgi:ribosome-interacting GTPase 1
MTLNKTKTLPELRASSVLTTSEVFYELKGYEEMIMFSNQLSLDIDFTKGSLTNCLIKIYTKKEGGEWVTLPSLSISAGVVTVNDLVITLTASTKFNFETPINAKHIRIGVQGTGTVTSSLLALNVALGNK